jgi:hypothetical protein
MTKLGSARGTANDAGVDFVPNGDGANSHGRIWRLGLPASR